MNIIYIHISDFSCLEQILQLDDHKSIVFCILYINFVYVIIIIQIR